MDYNILIKDLREIAALREVADENTDHRTVIESQAADAIKRLLDDISEIIQDSIRLNFLERMAETCVHTNGGRVWQIPRKTLFEGHTYRDAIDNLMTADE